VLGWGRGGKQQVYDSCGPDPNVRRGSHSLSLYMTNSASYSTAWSARVLQALSEASFRPARCLLAARLLCKLWSLWKKVYIAVIMVIAADSGG